MANAVTKISSHVAEKPKRRRFTADFKKNIIDKAALIEKAGGAVGELLRQNGLFYTQLVDWRRAYAEHGAAGLAARKPGRKATATRESKLEHAKLLRENARLKKKLLQAEMIIEIQKKVAMMVELGVESEP
jgi:transposase